MKKFRQLTLSLFAICVCTLGGFIAVDAQDETLELVDQHGQRVDVQDLKLGAKQQPANKQRRIDLRLDDGKIVIVEQDGTVREIDVAGAKNVFIRKSVQSVTENGQEKRRIAGKAIIIGPDGQRQEIELNDDGNGGEKLLGDKFFEKLPFSRQLLGQPRSPVQFEFASPAIEKYMIGVSCSPVSDQLRSHLDLEEGVGLVVSSEPRAGTPAARSGLRRHDILLSADGTDLATNNDLVTVVKAAGESERALSIKLVRRGEEIEVEVKPTMRQNLETRFEFGPNFQFERVGPGVLFDSRSQLSDQLLKRMETLDERIRVRIEELNNMHEKFLRSMPGSVGDSLRAVEGRTKDGG